METNSDQKREEARRRLLEEGSRSYLDAVSALIAYQREVQKMCKAVLEKHIEDYSSALGLKVPLETSKVQNEEWPAFAEWGNSWILGVKIVREAVSPKISWWKTSCCLEYDPDDAGLYCFIGEEYLTVANARRLFGNFHDINKKVKHHRYELWIPSDGHKVEEVCNLEEYLEGIVQEWIELWQKVGGIKKVFEE